MKRISHKDLYKYQGKYFLLVSPESRDDIKYIGRLNKDFGYYVLHNMHKIKDDKNLFNHGDDLEIQSPDYLFLLDDNDLVKYVKYMI